MSTCSLLIYNLLTVFDNQTSPPNVSITHVSMTIWWLDMLRASTASRNRTSGPDGASHATLAAEGTGSAMLLSECRLRYTKIPRKTTRRPL